MFFLLYNILSMLLILFKVYAVSVRLSASIHIGEGRREVQKWQKEQKLEVARVKLGSQELEVSRLGFGCQGLTGLFYVLASEEAGIAIIRDAFNKVVTFFDTADFYGGYTNVNDHME